MDEDMKKRLANLHSRLKQSAADQRAVRANSVWPPPERLIKTWQRNGLRCAVAIGGASYCGYVRLPPEHPFHGIEYSDRRFDPKLIEGRKYDPHHTPIIPLFCAMLDPQPKEEKLISMELLLDVHGGITFAEPDKDGFWWIGFDTAHDGDRSQQFRVNYDSDEEFENVKRIYREMDERFPQMKQNRLWTPGMVEEETNRLADQCAAVQ